MGNANVKYDKMNSEVGYLDGPHTYTDLETGELYTSVTTIIEHFAQPFDSEFWSFYKAVERLCKPFAPLKSQMLSNHAVIASDSFISSLGVSIDLVNETKHTILGEWEKKNKDACDRGTAIHLEYENRLLAGDIEGVLSEYGMDPSEFKDLPVYNSTDLEHNVLFEDGIFPEALISSRKHKIAGQGDVIIRKGRDIYVLDYKTNESIDTESFMKDWKRKKREMMQEPLNTLMDCNFDHYQLQLSLYGYLLTLLNKRLKVKELRILHKGYDNSLTPYPVEFKRKECIALLDWRLRQLAYEPEMFSKK